MVLNYVDIRVAWQDCAVADEDEYADWVVNAVKSAIEADVDRIPALVERSGVMEAVVLES